MFCLYCYLTMLSIVQALQHWELSCSDYIALKDRVLGKMWKEAVVA
jgi:hypothetical protein